MRMTPLDVQSHQFASRFRGFDPDEVEAFLRIVSEDYEGLVRENQGQADKIRRLESRMEELSAQEMLLKETLVSAQQMTQEMSQTAERAAEVRLAEVEIRAEKILDASHRRAARLAQDIREMKALRTRLAESLRSAAETHIAILETLESDPEQDPLTRGLEEGTVAYLKGDPKADGQSDPKPEIDSQSPTQSPAPAATPEPTAGSSAGQRPFSDQAQG